MQVQVLFPAPSGQRKVLQVSSSEMTDSLFYAQRLRIKPRLPAIAIYLVLCQIQYNILLKKYKNIIYVEGQSFLPYYTSTVMCLNSEDIRRNGMIDRSVENYKHHIMFIACESIAGICPGINNTHRID